MGRKVTLELPPEEEPVKQTPAEAAAEYAREAAGMDDDDAEDFFRGLDELRSTQGVVFQVYRTEPPDRAGFCMEYPGAIFTQARLTREYGPGSYRIRIKGPGGKYIPGGGTIKIAEAVPKEERDGETSSVQDMLALLKADREKSSTNMKEWAAILAPLLAPVIGNLFSGKSQVTELVTALGALQGLQPKPEKQPDMMSQLDQLSGVLGKLKEMSGSDNQQTGATWIDLVRDAIQGAKPVLEGIAAKVIAAPRMPIAPSPSLLPSPSAAPPSMPALNPSPISSRPLSDSATNTEISSPPPSDPMLQLLGWLKATAEQLAVQAGRDKDPEFYAEVVADNLPDGTTAQQLLDYIGRPDWWPMFSNFAPAVAPYQGWFSQFRDAFVAILTEQLPKEKPAPPSPPDPVPEPQSFE